MSARITWVVNQAIKRLPSGHLSSDLASTRYRAAMLRSSLLKLHADNPEIAR